MRRWHPKGFVRCVKEKWMFYKVLKLKFWGVTNWYQSHRWYEFRKYVHDPTHIIQPETIELDETLSFEQRPVKILNTKTRSTWNMAVKLVKVLVKLLKRLHGKPKMIWKNDTPNFFSSYAWISVTKLFEGVECDTNFLIAY